jgi:hypothetical protein
MGGTTRTLTYGYDAAGNRNALTWPDSVSFGVDHDVLGRPTVLGGGVAYIGYGDNGAPNGISRANGIMTWFGYDGA